MIKKFKKNRIIPVVFIIFLLGFSAYLMFATPNPSVIPVPAPETGISSTGEKLPSAEPGVEKKIGEKHASSTNQEAQDQNNGPPDQQFMDYLKEKFGDTIYNRWTQTKAVEKLMAYLQHFYPDRWQELVYPFLKKMFPDMADELYDHFKKLMEYRTWLNDHRKELNRMTRDERKEYLWDKRYQVFGDAAYEIWAVELKNDQIYEGLKKIDENPDMPFEEKTKTFLDSIEQAYGEDTPRFIKKRQTELMDRFLSVGSVQDDLHSMTAEERREKLRSFREAMGLDEEALKRWDELDRKRDEEWQKGMTYMEERKKLENIKDEKEREQALNELRTRIFGEQAAQEIAAEESAGFFRFDHKRVFGKE